MPPIISKPKTSKSWLKTLTTTVEKKSAWVGKYNLHLIINRFETEGFIIFPKNVFGVKW